MSPERAERSRHVLAGRKALITGIANELYCIRLCRAFRELGVDLAITYATEKSKSHVEPLAIELGAQLLLPPLDVGGGAQLQSVFDQIGQRWGRIDILLHSIAWAPNDDLHAGLLHCSSEVFARAMDTFRVIRSPAWRSLSRRSWAEPAPSSRCATTVSTRSCRTIP